MKKLLLALAFVLLASRAEAIGAFVQMVRVDGGGARVASVSATMTVTGGNLVVLIGYSEEGKTGGADTSGCSDNKGNTYVFIANDTSTPGGAGTQKLCYAANAANGSTTFTWTNQGGNTWSQILVVELSGMPTAGTIIDQVAVHNQSTANTNTGTTSATTHKSDVVIASIAVNSGWTTPTCGTGYTQIDRDGSFTSISFLACYKIVAVTGTQTMSVTSPLGLSNGAVVALKDSTVENAAGILPWLQ